MDAVFWRMLLMSLDAGFGGLCELEDVGVDETAALPRGTVTFDCE